MRLHTMGIALMAFALGCGATSNSSDAGASSGSHFVCTWVSSQAPTGSAGGYCRADYSCPSGHVGTSCSTAGDCLCLSGDNDTRGAQFTMPNFCAASRSDQQAAVEMNCLQAATDGG